MGKMQSRASQDSQPTPVPTPTRARTCSGEALSAICQKVSTAIGEGRQSLAVVVLPGSFNPVHSEHLRTLELAKRHLETQGVSVVGGFLQPSSDQYVAGKVGSAWAMTLEDRIATCELAALANSTENNCELWIHAWRSGQTNGFAVPGAVSRFLNSAVPEKLGTELAIPIVAYMVCGADLVERCGGWTHPASPPVVVLRRPGVSLPHTKPSEGWHLADGDMKEVSSTSIRKAISSEKWNELVAEGCSPAVVEFMSARHRAGTLFMSQ